MGPSAHRSLMPAWNLANAAESSSGLRTSSSRTATWTKLTPSSSWNEVYRSPLGGAAASSANTSRIRRTFSAASCGLVRYLTTLVTGMSLPFCGDGRFEVRQQGLPAGLVLVAPWAGGAAETLPAAVLDVDSGLGGRGGHEMDLDLGGVRAIAPQMPQVDQPGRGLPDGHFAPVELPAVECAFVDPPAHAALHDHLQPGFCGDGVIGRPPGADPRGPDGKRMFGRAVHIE